MRARGLLILSLAALAGCAGADSPTAPAAATPGAPRHEIVDWGRWGTEGFYFLPGTPPPGYSDASFDATLNPTVTICRVTSGVCGSTLATFVKTGTTSYGRFVTVNTTGRSYNVSWPVTTGNGYASGRTYRIKVRVSGRDLGYQEVQVVANSSQAAAVDTSEYKPVIIGNNYAISFRINQGIPASITLSSSSVAVGVGEGKTLTATMLDLRGNAMSTADIAWQIDNTSAAAGPVAELDSGLVIGSLAGTATLWAWYEDIEVSIPITVTDTRRQWTVMTTPDQEEVRALWGTSSTNIYGASNTGVLRYNGTAWAHEAAVRWRGMRDVYGTAANDVWAVGDNGFILHWNGTAWSAQRFNGTTVSAYNLATWDLPGQKVNLRSVFPIPGTNLIGVVGDNGTALTWDGSSWTIYDTGDGVAVTSLWGTAYTNLYVTLANGQMKRFDGSNYTTVSGVTAPGSMNYVWGTASNNIYAVGAGGMLWRFNGSSWSRIRLPTRAPLYAIWGTSASNIFVAGAEGALYRYNGTTWTAEKSGSADAQVYGFWAASNGDTFLSGAGGLIAKR